MEASWDGPGPLMQTNDLHGGQHCYCLCLPLLCVISCTRWHEARLASALWHLHGSDTYTTVASVSPAQKYQLHTVVPQANSMMCWFVALACRQQMPQLWWFTGQRVLCGERLGDRHREHLREMLMSCSGDRVYQGDKLSLQFFSLLEMEGGRKEKRNIGSKNGKSWNIDCCDVKFCSSYVWTNCAWLIVLSPQGPF